MQCGIVPYPFLENILESVPFKVILLGFTLRWFQAIEVRIMLACNVLIQLNSYCLWYRF